MKTKLVILAAMFSVALTSCKNEAETKKAEPSQPEVKQNFSVELDVVAEKDDNFAMYFTEDGSINFSLEHVAWMPVKGGTASQKVIYDLPEENIPTHIRLDFGLKKGAEQGDVTLHHVKITNYGKSFEFKGSDFFTYFAVNDATKTEVDRTNGTVKFLKNPNATNTPFYYPMPALIDEIAKITK